MQIKKRIAKLLLAVLVIGLLNCGNIPYTLAAERVVFEGSNKNDQYYSVHSSVVNSYLTTTSSGQIMRVQANYYYDNVLVEYYDKNYNLLSQKVIPEELDCFGAFYETKDNYYIISGQYNDEESAAVECFRVTQYDKNWNRIKSAGLYDCNTTEAFRSGACRVAQYNNYLIIRTSKKRYTSYDGYRHQSSMTMVYDINRNTITENIPIEYATGSHSFDVAYVSHSFNQFVQVDGDRLVTLDHGDAYPRAITLNASSLICDGKKSTGQLVDEELIDFMLDFYEVDITKGVSGINAYEHELLYIPGEIGDNYTYTSIGGLEVSSDAYLAVGNSTLKNNPYELTGYTRNIFVAADYKDGSGSEIIWLTDYNECDEMCTTTPHMVKVNDDLFVVMWSAEDVIYYQKIDGHGNKIGKTNTMFGQLSDCKPIVIDNKLVWYVWEDENVKFYELNVDLNLSYRTHVQSYGWQQGVKNGEVSGTVGQAKRLEGINISLGGNKNLGIQYTTHCQSYGWLPWSADGDMNGTEGEAKRLEAIKIQLTGTDKDSYDVYYRVHAQSYGWLGWAKNGEPSGTAGYGKRLEGIQILVVKKGDIVPNNNYGGVVSNRSEKYIAKDGSSPIVNYSPTTNTNPVIPGADTPNVSYRTHVQSFDWQGWKYNGQMSGTSGLAKRLEGIEIKLTNKPCEGDVVYTTHVQTYGWQGQPKDEAREGWSREGQMSGTEYESKRLEAICIDLTGQMGEKYDIYYRVHAQSFGWLGWAKNGEESGTAGYSKRLEGIQIVLVEKGGVAPSENYGGVTSNRVEAYVEK